MSTLDAGATNELSAARFVAATHFDANGLVPAIAQDALSGEVRMLAWMNREALERTLETREVHFFSRSRSALWKKGETSGHVLELREAFLDCDGDAIVLLVEPHGPTCHTGAASCFFRAAASSPVNSAGPAPRTVIGRPHAFASKLEAVLIDRAAVPDATSYTRRLIDEGATKIGAKIREEADEVSRAIAAESADRVASEAADVVYHLFVGLISRGVAWRDVLAQLARRFGVGGLVEKARRGDPGAAP